MSTPDTVPDDRPLTIDELDENHDPLFILADRLLPYLGEDWSARLMAAHDAILLGPDGMKILLTPYRSLYESLEYNPHWFYIGTYTPTGRPRERLHTDGMSVFTLPSQIAAHLNANIIPATRRRNELARRTSVVQQTKRKVRNEERRRRISSIARLLRWNASSYGTQSYENYASLDPRYRTRRPRGSTPVLEGSIGYDKDDTHMHVRLGGLPEALVDQIVDIVAAHYAPPRRRWPRSMRPSPRRKRPTTTDSDK